jgi:hypothetical protein
MTKLLLMMSLSLAMVVSASAEDKIAFTQISAFGCKSASDQTTSQQLGTDVRRAWEVLDRTRTSQKADEELEAAQRKFAAWVDAHQHDGSCYQFATDTMIVIDQQNNQQACIRVAGEGTWILDSNNVCYRIRALDACYFATQAERDAEKGNVRFLCKNRRVRTQESVEAEQEIQKCAQRHGDQTTCVWVSIDDLHDTRYPTP